MNTFEENGITYIRHDDGSVMKARCMPCGRDLTRDENEWPCEHMHDLLTDEEGEVL